MTRTLLPIHATFVFALDSAKDTLVPMLIVCLPLSPTPPYAQWQPHLESFGVGPPSVLDRVHHFFATSPSPPRAQHPFSLTNMSLPHLGSLSAPCIPHRGTSYVSTSLALVLTLSEFSPVFASRPQGGMRTPSLISYAGIPTPSNSTSGSPLLRLTLLALPCSNQPSWR